MKVRRWALGAAAVLAIAAASVAYAAIPGATGTISGCDADGKGALRVIDAEANEACGKREKALDWNQTGPKGDKGDPGRDGVSGYEIVNKRGTLEAAQAGESVLYVAVECPAGKKAVGGGGYGAVLDAAGAFGGYAQIASLAPFGGGAGWEVGLAKASGANFVPGTNGDELGYSAYAICVAAA